MVRGLYTSYTGMLNQQYRLDTITNNLANASTTAYKCEGVTSRAFDSVLAVRVKDSSVNRVTTPIGNLSLGVKIGENYTDYDGGSLVSTGNTYDLALDGDGFFAISYTSKSGVTSTMYTRDGEFITDVDGVLRTKDGDYVLNDGGSEITVPTTSKNIAINTAGDIYADGQYIDTISVVDFEDYDYLKKFGENLYEAVDGATLTDSTAKVNQGFLEASNVNVVEQMIQMIEIARSYESNQKVMQAIDDTLEKSVNQVGAI